MQRALILAIWLCATSAGAQDFTTLKGHGGPIMDIAVDGDGRVATASFDNSVGLWEGGAPVWLEGHAAAVGVVTFHGDGMLVSGGDDFSVRLWSEGGVSRVLGQHRGKVTDVAVSTEAGLVASASWDGTIGLMPLDADWASAHYPPLEEPEPRFLEAPGAVNAVAFSGPDTLYAGTSTGELMRFDLAKGAMLPIIRHGFGINEVIVTDDWIAYGAVDGGTRIIDHEGAEIADFTLDRRPILSMAHHAGTHQLAVGDGHGYIMMLDTEDWRITRDFRATREGPVWALAFSPDGTTIWAGGLDDVAFGWPVAALDAFEPGISGARSFLRPAEDMSNGERQFMRKCSICHALGAEASRKAGPSLHGLFGRRAGTVPGYNYSATLTGSTILWDETTVDALFDEGPDHYVPGTKMPMQVIAAQQDRADLIEFLKQATRAPVEHEE
ncbi:c-type cytochrome [Primorskyibacter flagellatus]|uniref:Cytochrome c n=1 Tax=Primorskyibacter flagellatus TaxID=1387277 RepID=A0A1W2ALH2_9RHOB|nr:c-type cytochrome [Primorskyibacter flagellatus]SMC61547.1 cytochrome c [Primorskyibacter flagellatus]